VCAAHASRVATCPRKMVLLVTRRYFEERTVSPFGFCDQELK